MKKVDWDNRIMRAIMDGGDYGVLQMDIWKKVRIDSKKGGKIVEKLERQNLIRRDLELHNNKRTYRLFAVRKTLSMEAILDVPCLKCVDLDRCNVGGSISPNSCKLMTDWLLAEGQTKLVPVVGGEKERSV